MKKLIPLRHIPETAGYRPGDVLVVFGEIFSRGYVNGLVDEAVRAGLKVVRSTVGRRDSDGTLRALNTEELAAQPRPFINIPLEAGFDLEPCAQDGSTPVDQLKSVKMSEWDSVRLDWAKIEDSRARAKARFRDQTAAFLTALEKEIPPGANVLFAHTMAGGVPRAKIYMPTMNKVFKGTGERFVDSQTFWNSELGRLAELNFDDVTAGTFAHLMDLSASLRGKIESAGGQVSYVAYGYHGTEVLMNGQFRWQSYAPYLQGWAKMRLEDEAASAWKNGLRSTVFNCPEILTNSSSIFVGVEVPLYTFMSALRKNGDVHAEQVLGDCAKLLKPGVSVETVAATAGDALGSDELQSVCHFENWPEHSNRAQMERMILASETLVGFHQDPKNLITFVLSEEIFRATGKLMFHYSWKPESSVVWLGHDILARALKRP